MLALGTVAVCVWCGWVSGFHRSTVAAEVTWVVSLGAVVAVDVVLWRGHRGLRPGWRLEPAAVPWPRPGRGGARRALLGVVPWLVLLLVVVTWDVLGLLTGPHQYHLTISALAQAYRPLNAGVLLVWMLVGVGYQVARVRAPMPRAAGRDQHGARPAAPGTAFGAAVAMGGGRGHAGLPALLLPQRPGLGVAFWVAVPVAAAAVDLAARRSDGRVAGAEELVRFVSTARVLHLVLIVAWAYAGYHLFAS